ncbi:CGNR zinc finger domain-containing protein [Streptomyces sp. NPDC058632]|uniref:CGNR zinc finger domain-containing protein n=1 Tax=unclassified Streptomyces TaxID=2593676 RepID=UPI003667B3E0
MGTGTGNTTTPPPAAAGADPRPLRGEPLSLDLLNTRWVENGVAHDLLEDPDGFARWLADHALPEPAGATPAALAATREARDALAAVVEDPGDEGARQGLNTVLARGRVLRALGPDGPVEQVEPDDPAWLTAWLAAADYLRLVGTAPDRVRACANDECVLHFYDVSRNGTRRWCSMSGCGNRAKASRHYARTRRHQDRKDAENQQ